MTCLRRLPALLLATALLVVAGDHLLAVSRPAAGLALCILAFLVLTLLRHAIVLRQGSGILLALGVLLAGLGCLVDRGWLAPMLALLGLGGLVGLGRSGRFGSVAGLPLAVLHLAGGGLARLATDPWRLLAWLARHPALAWSGRQARWLLPLLLAGGFLGLFSLANPVLGRWLAELLHLLVRLGGWLPGLGQLALWWLLLLAAWTVLRSRSRPRPSERSCRPVATRDRRSLVWRSLLTCSAVFALQVLLDVRYLLAGAALPPELTYAEYAHRGAWPLLIAALVSAAFVLAWFRPGHAVEEDPWCRRLVAVWLGLNVCLVLGAVWRLHLYVDAYGLTRWRLAAAAWMLLVACGVGLLLWRILSRRGNGWLVEVNARLLAALLLLVCLLDLDGLVAWHDVGISRELGGRGPVCDLDYLGSLGPGAAPALAHFALHCPDPGPARMASDLARALKRRARDDCSDWRGWSLVRYRAASLRGSVP